MSHCAVVVLFPGSPTLDQIEDTMRPFHYGSNHEELSWDYYIIREWGNVGRQLRTDRYWFGQIVDGRFARYDREAVTSRRTAFYVWVDVHE